MVNENEWFLEPMESKGTLFGLKLDGERLHAEQSAFQHIEIYQTETFGKLMVIDGCVMLTDRDNFLYHEMIAHPALCLHPNPRRVLIIGGGDCGTLREVLRHPQVESAVQVDIDERVTRLAEEYPVPVARAAAAWLNRSADAMQIGNMTSMLLRIAD